MNDDFCLSLFYICHSHIYVIRHRWEASTENNKKELEFKEPGQVGEADESSWGWDGDG